MNATLVTVWKPVCQLLAPAFTEPTAATALRTLPEAATRNDDRRLLDGPRTTFRVILRRDRMTSGPLPQALVRTREKKLNAGRQAPLRADAQNLATRFRQDGAAYFGFMPGPHFEPRKNQAAQARGFVVMDRRIPQCAQCPQCPQCPRSERVERGQQWCERIWTVIAALPQQGRSILAYLRQAVRAYLTNQAIPALLPVKP